MSMNKPYYMQLPNVKDIINTSPDFDHAASECATSKTFSSMWAVYALSSASAYTIDVIYPAVNGPDDFGPQALNVQCTPRQGNRIKQDHINHVDELCRVEEERKK